MSKRIFVLLLAILIQSTWANADELLIITAKDTSEPSFSQQKIANIFRRQWLINNQGERWIPVNLVSSHPLRQLFSQALFDQTPEELENYWNIKYFQGIAPPHSVASQRAMLRFISTTPNAIGYIYPCLVSDQVKVIFKLTIKPTNPLDFCLK